MDPGMDMTMCMYFYNDSKVKLLFKGWDPQSNGAYFGCLIAVFLVAFLAESLSAVKAYLDRTTTALVKTSNEG